MALPSFGLSIPVPEGFARAPDSAHSVAVFFPQDQLGRRPDRVIMINLTARRGKKLGEIVQETAAQSQMKVVDNDARWGGQKATEMMAPDPGTTAAGVIPRTLRTVLLEREGFVFALSYLADPQHAGELRGFQDVVRNTQWLPIARAGAGLGPRQPDALVANGLRINIPDPFRPDPESNPKQGAVFIARDLPTRVAVAKIVVLPLPRKEKIKSMQDMKAELDRQLVPSWKLKGRLGWDDRPGAISLSLSNKVETTEGWMQALLILAQDTTPTIISIHCRKTEDAVQGFERAMLLVRASIRAAQ